MGFTCTDAKSVHLTSFHGSLTLNNGKLIGHFKTPWYDIDEHAAFIDVFGIFWSDFLLSLSHHMLNCQLM